MCAGFGFDVEQDYFHWLCEIMDVERMDRSYWLLARDLFLTPFYSLVPHDENRAMDGVALREEYMDEINYPKYVQIEGECSVFEMLVALARRIDFEMSDPYVEKDDSVAWFWTMIDNLGLSDFTDEHYVELDGMGEVERILSRFLERNYKRNGEGGLFPLTRSKADQRKVEIWYQMNEYLMENEAV